jgi:energy-coupling factor transport system ATP-binding protein
VQFDDLDRLVEGRRLRREAHHQDGADGEVGGDQDADPRRVGQPAAQRGQPLLVEAGGADHGVDAVLDAVPQVVHHHVRVGEVDHDLGLGLLERRDRVPRVHPGDQGQIVGGLHRRTDLGSDLAPRAQHTHVDHDGQPTGPGCRCAHAHVARTDLAGLGPWWCRRFRRGSGGRWT